MPRPVDHLRQLVVPDVVDALDEDERSRNLLDPDVLHSLGVFLVRHVVTVSQSNMSPIRSIERLSLFLISSIFSISSFLMVNFIRMMSLVTSIFLI